MQATTAGVRLDVGKAARFSALCSQLSFRPPAAHPVEPFILPKTREGVILAPQPCRIWGMSVKEYLFTGDLMTAAEAERIGLINHVVPADQLDEKVYGLARRLAGGAIRSIRWTKQTVNIPLRQLAHSMMDLSLSLETQSNLTKD